MKSKTTKRWTSKLLAFLIIFAMVFSMMPTSAYAADSGEVDTVDQEWWNFRNNDENNAVTDRPTPTDTNETALKWAEKYGTGWTAAPTPPLILDGYLYIGVANKVLKLDKNTGEKLAESPSPMVGNVGYAMNPILYADGKLFVQVGNGTIQAVDYKTLEPVWSTESVGGQTVSPISYKKINGKGYIYTGTWNRENVDGAFVCVSTDDSNVSADNKKKPTWKFIPSGSTKDSDDSGVKYTYDPDLHATLSDPDNVAKRGFYWAGAYVNENYLAVGSDDGTNEGNYTANAVFYTLDPESGEIIDRIDGIKGDIRTTTVYDNGYLYFSTKGGHMYKVAVDSEGNLGTYSYIDLGGMTTASPLVYKDRIYIGVCGPGGQFDPDGGHFFAVVDNSKETLDSEPMYKLPIKGYPQAPALLSTANEDVDYDGDGKADGRVYIYFTYNAPPGGIYFTYDTPDQKDAAEISEELFIPEASMQEYCISAICADREGTLYYKNDSVNLFAVEKNEAYLKGATVTNDKGALASWNPSFDTRTSNYNLKVPTLSKSVNIDLDLIEGSTATVNGQSYDKSRKAKINIVDGEAEAKITISKNGYTRTYTLSIECMKDITSLSSLLVNDSNTYGAGTKYTMLPAFDPEVLNYSADVTDATSRTFYNVWPAATDSESTVKVYPLSNIGTRTSTNEDGSVKVMATNQGHDRYAIYPADVSKSAKIKIEVTSENGANTSIYNLTLLKRIDVDSVSLNYSKYSLDFADQLQLEAYIEPTYATYKTVKWYSSDEEILTVDENGLVTPVKEGKAEVTVITDNKSKVAKCEITVTDKLSDDKDEAIAGLEAYLDKEAFRESLKGQIDKVLEGASKDIRNAKDLGGIEIIVSDAQDKLDTINEVNDIANEIDSIDRINLDTGEKLDNIRQRYNDLSEEGKAMIDNYEDFLDIEKEYKDFMDQYNLDVNKGVAKDRIDEYVKDINLYRQAEQEEIARIVEEGKEKIDGAGSTSEVEQVLSAAMESIDGLKTDQDYKDQARIDSVKDKRATSVKFNLNKKYTTVKASWKKVSGVDGYRVYYKASSAEKWSTYNTTKTSWSKKLKAGKKYSLKVVPYVKVDGKTYLSKAKPVSKSTTTLKKTAVKLKKSGKKSVKISWKNIAGETGYQVYRSSSKNGKYKKVKTLSVNKTAWTDGKKVKGKTYYYKVRAYKKVDGKNIYAPFSSIKKIKR